MGVRGANEECKQDQEERLRKLRLVEDAQAQESDLEIRNLHLRDKVSTLGTTLGTQ